MTHPDAVAAATAHVYQQFQAQARLLAFMDCFHVLGVVTLVAVPLVLFTRHFRVSGRGGSSH